RHDYAMSIDSGQVLWLGVKREERQNYGKNARNTEIVPVKLTLLSLEDIDLLSSGFSTREVREVRMVRIFICFALEYIAFDCKQIRFVNTWKGQRR
ncbi:MAG: DUF1670 domain-containing protein, partial [Proteobacteria bacterium]|nr:DUF1670 domain-containing protein [Pseudomonadota bacterium]